MKLTGIGTFAFEIISLLAYGKTESVFVIEQHFDKGDVVEYIYYKYRDYFTSRFDDDTYDSKAINKYFSEYSGNIQGNELKKCKIMNKSNGLLLILSLLMDKVREEDENWTVE